MDFHETSIKGILVMRLLKISCIWKTFTSSSASCIHSSHTCIHIYIHACRLMCLTTIFLCQMQSWNQCACYILAHLCPRLIPSATGIWILKGVMRYVIFWINWFIWKNNSYKRQGFQVFGSVTGFCHHVSCAISHLAFLFFY